MLLGMRSHPGSVDLLKEACALLWAMSVNEDCAGTIGARPHWKHSAQAR